MNLNRIRARLDADPAYRARMAQHYALHKRRFHADFDHGVWPQRHHSRSNFFWGMALDGQWDALVQWRPVLNTPQ